MAAAWLSRVSSNRFHVSNWKMNVPVIVVCGATGTGKSKLGIEIAQRYGGQVISADSMQVDVVYIYTFDLLLWLTHYSFSSVVISCL